MEVHIKRFNVEMKVKTSGIEFEVQNPRGKGHRGDLVLTKTKLIWCPGRTRPKNGHKVSWDDFIKWVEDRSKG